MRDRARALRRGQTDAERLLWSRLRNRRLAGHKFRRQCEIAPYIVDFACVEAKLIVELDGGQHQVQLECDDTRSRYLATLGFKVLRYWNNDVLAKHRRGIGGHRRCADKLAAAIEFPCPAARGPGCRGRNKHRLHANWIPSPPRHQPFSIMQAMSPE